MTEPEPKLWEKQVVEISIGEYDPQTAYAVYSLQRCGCPHCTDGSHWTLLSWYQTRKEAQRHIERTSFGRKKRR